MEKRHSVFFLQKASEEKSSSRVIFTLKSVRQWVLWRMTSTNHATSQRTTFRSQVAFVDVLLSWCFFFWEESNKNKIIQEVVFRGQKKNPFPALTGGSIVQETDAKLEEPMLWVDLWAE